MREPDEAAGMILFGWVHAVVDQAAGSKVWLIEARAAGEHRNVDARLVHHPNMRREIGEQRIEPINWISVFVEAEATLALAGLHQLGWCIMMLKINKHFSCSEGDGARSSSSSAQASTSDIRQKAPQGL